MSAIHVGVRCMAATFSAGRGGEKERAEESWGGSARMTTCADIIVVLEASVTPSLLQEEVEVEVMS